MGYRPSKPALRQLSALAQEQAGYFTAKQAAEVGEVDVVSIGISPRLIREIADGAER